MSYRKLKTKLNVALWSCALASLAVGGCQGESGDKPATPEMLTEEFHGWMVARSVGTATTVDTVLYTDDLESELLTVQHRLLEGTFAVHHPDLQHSQTYPAKTGALPSLQEANQIAVRLYQVMPTAAEAEDRVAYDNFGCDTDGWQTSAPLPTSCGQDGACCDSHDQCYDMFGCTAASWVSGSWQCNQCNNEVVDCIVNTNPGSSGCCDVGNCGEPRPNDCQVEGDGQCGGDPGGDPNDGPDIDHSY